MAKSALEKLSGGGATWVIDTKASEAATADEAKKRKRKRAGTTADKATGKPNAAAPPTKKTTAVVPKPAAAAALTEKTTAVAPLAEPAAAPLAEFIAPETLTATTGEDEAVATKALSKSAEARRRKTKTRSRQKNIKKDTRTDDQRPAHLRAPPPTDPKADGDRKKRKKNGRAPPSDGAPIEADGDRKTRGRAQSAVKSRFEDN